MPTETIPETLTINGKVYVLTKLTPDPRVARVAYRLGYRKGGGWVTYDVHEGSFGWECECADFVYRKEGSESPCKHVAAVLEAGL